MSHIPPQHVAMGDQIMAEASTQLDEVIERFRDHAAQHGGEILCPFGEVVMRVFLEPHYRRDLPEMFAAAVARLAKEARHG